LDEYDYDEEAERCNIMFHEEQLPNVGIRLRLGEKEERMHTDLDISSAG
jgi:hypothetical protein